MGRAGPGRRVEDVHVPGRTCIGCGRKAPQGALVRIRLEAGKLLRGTGAGRGAYVCGVECARLAARKKAFGRAFKGKVQSPAPEEIERLFGLTEGGRRD